MSVSGLVLLVPSYRIFLSSLFFIVVAVLISACVPAALVGARHRMWLVAIFRPNLIH